MTNTLEDEIRCPECRRKILADMILERGILECHYCSAKFLVSTYQKIETFYLTEKMKE